ncbi:MAG: hypothetical protein HYU51_16200 [Candidatus Rokubacteria bacterium]|nr:hypothetical protein [Candidatus Rokubacteria bacterium]
MTLAERRRLTAVARAAAPADIYVAGGTLLNVYTGEIYRANVAIAGARIAYVGVRDDMVGPKTRVVDAAGRVLVPGYLAADVLPSVRLTPRGVRDVKRSRVPLGSRCRP